jgi:hypothetical protein
MSGRAIASIVWTALTGGTKLAVKVLWHLNRGKKMVKRGAKQFQSELVSVGIPMDTAAAITGAFTSPGLDMLKIRNMISMVREITQD